MGVDYCLSHYQVSFIQSHASLLSDLPEPDDEWHRSDLPEYLREDFQRYREIGVVDRATERNGRVRTWRTNPDAWKAIQDHAPDETLLPCGHSGFTNKGTENERPYECNDCGRRFKRADISL